MTRLSAAVGCLVGVLASCQGVVSEPGPKALPDAGAMAVVDAGSADAATPDAGPAPDAGAPDAGVPDAGGPDAGPGVDAGTGRVPIFIAHGKLGRTTVSCDDGRTWIANRSERPNARCWDATAAENIECDHHAWSSVGMVEADGYFLATYGWGYPGMVRRTEDGVNWTDVLPGKTFAGMAWGNGRVMANDHAPWTSTDAGAAGTWVREPDISSVGWTVRRIAFVPATGSGPGRFIITLNSEILLSDDNGKTWQVPATRPAACASNTSNLVSGNGVTVLLQGDGSVCRSLDRGTNWTHHAIAPGFSSPALFEAGAFYAWDGATRYRSTDGLTWVSAVGTPSDVSIGAVARSANGTFVATRAGWQVWYEKQRFYRSADGITWEVLPATAFVASHPITSILFGHARPSVECPL